MKNKIIIVLALSYLFTSCFSDDDIDIYKDVKNPINAFVWNGMNSWYQWQENVPILDDKLKDSNFYSQLLNKYNKPEELFDDLIYKKNEVDHFSWFIEDYVEQAERFQGISRKSYGASFARIGLKGNNEALIVKKVSKNGPVAQSGIKRGDLIIGLNGTKLNSSNYASLIKGLDTDNCEFIVGKYDGSIIKKHKITRAEVQDDAIQLTKVFNINGKKVGYFVYNGFRSNFDKKVNEVFAAFKADGIQELILDLRYNGGGSVRSCQYLASLIYGQAQAHQDIFAKTKYNKNHPKYNETYHFLDAIYNFDASGNYINGGDTPLNRLTTLNRLYVITTNHTASASEMIINGLRPYMNVITVGTKTTGKNYGSFTMYDSPKSDFLDIKTANKDHKCAMQAITFRIFNKNDQSEYSQGFEPNIPVNEYSNLSGFLSFGNENETLLKVVLNKIKGVSARQIFSNNGLRLIDDKNIFEHQLDKQMYIESKNLTNTFN